MYGTLGAAILLIAVTGVVSPRWHGGRGCRSNENAAIATLRNIHSAQERFREGAFADENGNGIGEYGSLAELSGAAPVRGGVALKRPLLSAAFRGVGTLGVSRVRRSGYWIQVHFALPGGKTATERLRGGLRAGDVDADLAERYWCAYAWPVEHGRTGRRTFFVNQAGVMLATDDVFYEGVHGPKPNAAFCADHAERGIAGMAAKSTRGRDGNRWDAVG